MLHRLFLLLAALTCCISTYADDYFPVEINIGTKLRFKKLSDSTCEVFRADKLGSTLTIPSYVNDKDGNEYKVISIGEKSFYNSDLVNVYIPTTVTTIKDRAFDSCSKLEYVETTNSIKSIGDFAFYFCKKLINFKMPQYITSIGQHAFAYCESLESIIIPGTLKRITNDAFNSCKNLKNVTIGYGVETIGWQAFSRCGLKTVNIPNSVKEIEGYAFESCSELESFVMSDNISFFSFHVFVDTKWEKDLNIYDKNHPITAYYIGKDDYILYRVYGKTDSCTKISIKEGTRIVAGNALKYLETEEISFPNSVTYIGDFAMEDNPNLKTVTIGENVDFIGMALFFYSCPTEIAEIVCYNSRPPQYYKPPYISFTSQEDLGPFYNLDTESCTLYVEAKSLELYKNAEYWKDFKNIKAIPGSTITTFSIDNVDLSRYKTVDIPISMTNDDEIIAFQCDIVLPEGIKVEEDEYGDYEIALTDRAHKTHIVTAQDVDDAIRLVAYSSKNIAFTGNEGPLFTLPLSVTADMDECEITVKNIYVTDIDRQEKAVADVTVRLPVIKAKPGDANGDGAVSVTDIAYIVDCIMNVENPDVVLAGADANGDGSVTVTDITVVIDTIMNNK